MKEKKRKKNKKKNERKKKEKKEEEKEKKKKKGKEKSTTGSLTYDIVREKSVTNALNRFRIMLVFVNGFLFHLECQRARIGMLLKCFNQKVKLYFQK